MTDKRLVFSRAFPVTVERTGTHQLTGRLVPYNQVANVADPQGDGTFDIYQEGFRPGAFGNQVNAREPGVSRKIGLIHRHDGGLGFLGPFVGLREQPDGLYGDVRITPSKADDVEALLDAGINELSVEFRLHKSRHTEVDTNGVRWRTGVHLDNVALEPKGAYDARVVADRNEIDEMAGRAAKREEAEPQGATRRPSARRLRPKAEKERIEQAAQEAADRRKRFDELAARVPADAAKQQELVKTYGVTRLPARP